MNTTSPVEYLVAFGFTFLAGVIATVGMQQYTKYIKNKKEIS